MNGKTEHDREFQPQPRHFNHDDASNLGSDLCGDDGGGTVGDRRVNGADGLVRLLGKLLQRSARLDERAGEDLDGAAWESRRALVCVAAPHEETIKHLLADANFEVTIAANTIGAIKRMREDYMSVVVIDSGFDTAEQGALFLTREIGTLRLAERRRVFVILMSDSVRTADAHAAFLGHVNLVLNRQDIAELPELLDRSMRDFKELYREFNKAFGTA